MTFQATAFMYLRGIIKAVVPLFHLPSSVKTVYPGLPLTLAGSLCSGIKANVAQRNFSSCRDAGMQGCRTAVPRARDRTGTNRMRLKSHILALAASDAAPRLPVTDVLQQTERFAYTA